MERTGKVASEDRLLLSVSEAAHALAVSRTTFYELMWRGEITPIHIGRSVRIAKSELLRFVALRDEAWVGVMLGPGR
jgi:excisionase family DNA binding protein